MWGYNHDGPFLGMGVGGYDILEWWEISELGVNSWQTCFYANPLTQTQLVHSRDQKFPGVITSCRIYILTLLNQRWNFQEFWRTHLKYITLKCCLDCSNPRKSRDILRLKSENNIKPQLWHLVLQKSELCPTKEFFSAVKLPAYVFIYLDETVPSNGKHISYYTRFITKHNSFLTFKSFYIESYFKEAFTWYFKFCLGT